MADMRPVPRATEDTAAFWEGLRNQKVLIQKCGDCDHLQFYPRPFCVTCLSENVAWVDASGHGTVYTYTINHMPGNVYMQNKVPYAVAVVQLEEGVKVMGNIVDSDLSALRIGVPVQAVFERVDDEVTLLQFKLK